MTKSYILHFLNENKSFLKQQYQVNSIGLFGSFARDEHDENSDIDIVVDMPSSFDAYYDLKYFLEDAFNKRVDLGLKNSLRKLIESEIEKEIIYV
jgi:predicted nucleotidyltransferase